MARYENTLKKNPKGSKRKSKFLEVLQEVNQRTNQRVNQLNKRMPSGKKSLKAAIEEYSLEESFDLSSLQYLWRTLLGLLLLIPSVISTCALFTVLEVVSMSFWRNLIGTREFIVFLAGGFLMTGLFFIPFLRRILLVLYVFGHELTHVFFIYICGGNIGKIKVSSKGGYVETDTTNILIALSPYFVPFWTIVFLCYYFVTQCFIEIPHGVVALYAGIGSTWAFHMIWTFWMIPKDQPDLKDNGTFFSLMVIYLANVLLLALFLCIVPRGITFSSYYSNWLSLWDQMFDLAKIVVRRAFLL